MAIASLFFPFDLKGKIITFTFILVLGVMSLGITSLVEYITNKFREREIEIISLFKKGRI
ncbi:hypothetical protein [Bacillus cereus group sp. RP43]|uniref:hypothetical protein n=1 Tax=Bacillus cereus group sp. RP43 TaxID=3040260 RepID=UPI00339653FA